MSPCRWRSRPSGSAGMQHADGEIHACRAAQKFGVPYTLSTMSVCSLEEVAKNVEKPFWFQLYVMRDRGFTSDLVARAKAAKCSALVLTLDLQLLGQRHKDIRNGLSDAAQDHHSQHHQHDDATRAGAPRMLGTKNRTLRQYRRPCERREDLARPDALGQHPV